jgi:hypothetical protein
MTPLDLLDQSFLRRRPVDRRRMSDAAGTGAAAVADPPPPPRMFAALAASPSVPQDEPAEHARRAEDGDGDDRDDRACVTVDPFLARLLADAPLAWRRVADCVAEAHGRGRRSIAVTGSRHGEGRSTLVRGVAHLLHERGLKVECVDAPDPGDWREDVLVLVDAGIWFPPGPLRRQPLAHRSLGCDAVIIVRRADQPPCPARAAMIESVGLELLGEVVTFAPAEESSQ